MKSNAQVMTDIHGNVLQVGDLVACDTVGHQDLAVGFVSAFGTKMVKISHKRSAPNGTEWEKQYNKYPTQCILIRRANGDTEETFTKTEMMSLRDTMVYACVDIAAKYPDAPVDMIEEFKALAMNARPTIV